ncbi:MAG: hypothetical protein L0Z50_06430 [Verrucomicrobiales bacterium]|nr:hypothetical protein [Verrucomicrobiales bacterium]
MSAYEALLQELARQPDSVAQKLLDYLHGLALGPAPKSGASGGASAHFLTYWSRFYGAFEGEEWEEPRDLPYEKREEW